MAHFLAQVVPNDEIYSLKEKTFTSYRDFTSNVLNYLVNEQREFGQELLQQKREKF